LRGLNKGLAAGLNSLEDEVASVLENYSEQHQAQVQSLHTLIGQCTCADDPQQRLSVENGSPLARMLVE
jgi:hypothetical protein